MSISIGGGLSSYTSSYGSSITPKLDKNNDSQWSKNELDNYAASLKKANGTELDTTKLMETYDEDGDGALGASEQRALLGNDGLRLSSLYNQTGSVETQNETAGMEWVSKMSPTQSSYLYKATQMSEQMSSLFSSLDNGNSNLTNSYINIVSNQNAAKIYNIQNKYSASAAGAAGFDLSV